MNILLRILCIPLLVMIFALVSRSELPPAVYENLKKNAAEKIEFFVRKISAYHEKDKRTLNVSATVAVSKVYRSASGLIKGQQLTVSYTITRGIPGPSSPLFLRTGNAYIAYLNTRDGEYVPCAGGKSFSPVNTFREDYLNSL